MSAQPKKPGNPLEDICATLGLPPRVNRTARGPGPWPWPLAGAVAAPPWKPDFDPVAALRRFLVGGGTSVRRNADGSLDVTTDGPGRLAPGVEDDARDWLALVRTHRQKDSR